MATAKWDFRIERPVETGGDWSIAYTLIAPQGHGADELIQINEHYPSAQTAISEATRLAQIHVADLNGSTATFEKPSGDEAPFGEHPRF